MSKTPRLPCTQLQGELQGVWLLSVCPRSIKSCLYTPVYLYQAFILFWGKGSRGWPGDEANRQPLKFVKTIIILLSFGVGIQQ